MVQPMKQVVPPAQPVKAEATKVIRKIDSDSIEEGEKTMTKRYVIGVYVLLVLLGIGTGYLLSGKMGGGSSLLESKPTVVKTDKGEGSTDTKTFKDSAEGTIEKGGMDGEGSHKLVREGGESQTAFLISSVIDLDEYVGKKVKVWGQTFAAKKASWLMDVGKIELLTE
jgi:hypothetical protein